MLITLVPCNRSLWEDFKQYHYMKTPLNKASRTFLAMAGGVPIGFCASLPLFSGTLKNAYRAHKTVVRLPESPTMFKLWALVADAQARLHVAEGKRFFSAAPIAYAAYRDNPESIWVPTSTDRQREKMGFRSHESQAPQSGWVPTSKDKKRMETGFRSHEYVAAESHPAESSAGKKAKAGESDVAYWLPEPAPQFTPLARKLRQALADGAMCCTDAGEFAAKIKSLGGCTITPKNVKDTRCLSMAEHRLHYCGQKVRVLMEAIGRDDIDTDTATAALSVLDTYRQAFANMAEFATSGMKVVEKYQAAIVPA